MADEGPTVEIQNDAWFAAGRRIGEQAREIAELRVENERLREAQTALLEQNERFAVVIGELRSAIDKHNDA